MADEIADFVGLRPFQQHVWHAFLVNVAALALHKAGLAEPRRDTGAWRDLLRGLTPDFPEDEPWSLVAPADKPAFLQPPVPGGSLSAFKNAASSPDEIDLLVTAKNHDVKQKIMAEAAPDHWLYALVSLQTQQGYSGKSNYGISRMNGGFASRPGIGIALPGGPGARIMRDVVRLVAHRDELLKEHPFRVQGGLGLVWLAPWDGTTSLTPEELDPFYLEICRRIRLVERSGRIVALGTGTAAPRIKAAEMKGNTGDPWSPLVSEKDGTKALTIDPAGFGYRRMVRILFSKEIVLPPLARPSASDPDEGLVVLAQGLVRGQGKTEGYHEREVPVSRRIKRLFVDAATEPLAEIARERVKNAGDIGRALYAAIVSLHQQGPEQIKRGDKASQERAQRWTARFDRQVDQDFFERLAQEAEVIDDPDEAGRVRDAWRLDLHDRARALLDEAADSAPGAVMRRYRAIVRARSIFASVFRKAFPELDPQKVRDVQLSA